MYDAKNAKQEAGVKPGVVGEGVIIDIRDGRVNDFLSDEAKVNWKGDLDATCIEVTFETLYNGESYRLGKIFTYKVANGRTVYYANSNLGKFFRTYGKLPEVGDKVNLMTDASGFFRLVMNQ